MLDCLADPASDEDEQCVEWLGDRPFDQTVDLAMLTKRVVAVAKRLTKRYPG